MFGPVLGKPVPGAAADAPVTVSELAQHTRALVESGLPPVWVRGEISDFKSHRNGHWYFCLR
ncbi:MAG: exodeoxyribonuclease VII large subunit, partial [Actinobacteria bacterium]|nr:exodeoxyribonuclease VII large subunit [Actinomycetota bacterium]